MAITLKLQYSLSGQQEQWLAKNVGPRLHYLHNSIGGVGWIAKQNWKPGMSSKYWTLTFEDERYASWFRIMFPE